MVEYRRCTTSVPLVSSKTRMILLDMLIMALLPYIPMASAHSLYATQGRNSSIAWGSCNSSSLSRRNGECGFLAVPLDYSKPDGEKIQIAVSRIKSNTSRNKYQGIMLVNPGGPGGSGLTLAVLGSYVPDGVGQTYDWIGFDPRGVGDSKPAVSCDPNFLAGPRPDYVPDSFGQERVWLKRSRAYAKACEENNGKILRHLTTIDIVKDMESIRIALGEEKINYYGFSYGTYLGQVYATLYPDRVRRMVLDSNVDARRIWFDANLDQDTSFDRVFQIWFEWLARYNDTFKLGDEACEVENTWNQVMKDLTRNPINGTVGSSEWFDAFIAVGYTQSVWIEYGQAFSDWVHKRDADQIIQMYLDANNPAMITGTQFILQLSQLIYNGPGARILFD